MKLSTLIKKVRTCYDKRSKSFFAEIPAEWGNDILKYLEELENVRAESEAH